MKPSKVSPNSQTTNISFCLLSLSWPLPKCLAAFWHITNNLRLSWIVHLVCLCTSQRINFNLKYFSFHFLFQPITSSPIPKRNWIYFFFNPSEWLRSGVVWKFWGELAVTLYVHQTLIIHQFYTLYLFIFFWFLNCIFLYMQLDCKASWFLIAKWQHQSQHFTCSCLRRLGGNVKHPTQINRKCSQCIGNIFKLNR